MHDTIQRPASDSKAVYGESVLRFEKARVLSVAEAGAGLLQVDLQPPAAFAHAYVHVGQYVQVKADGATAYFALCSDPGDLTWTLLVRPRGDVAEALQAADVGAAFSVSEPLGVGFDWPRTVDADVFVVVAGTGFAIAPPILRARIREGAGAATALLIGSDGHVALGSALREMEASQVTITLCAPALSKNLQEPAHFPVVPTDLETTLAAKLNELRSRLSKQQRRRVCVFAAGPEALLATLQEQLRLANELEGVPWCELLLNA